MFSLTADGQKQYACTLCDHTSFSLYSFTDHMLTHSTVYPYGCNSCSLRFTTNIQLSRHAAQHKKNEKPRHETVVKKPSLPSTQPFYSCPKCDYKSKRCDGLVFHATQHIALYKYTCTICFLNFHRADHLTRHLNDQHKSSGIDVESCENRKWKAAVRKLYKDDPSFAKYEQALLKALDASYMPSPTIVRSIKLEASEDSVNKEKTPTSKAAQCSPCMMTFRNRIQLYWHNKKVHGFTAPKNYQCSMCEVKFASSGSLSRHVNNMHKSNAIDTSETASIDLPFSNNSHELVIDQTYSAFM
ncbi:hypothetical protein EB796_007247 [Bugula neritina]|uniref:C2H2-type domain-containing protein n=1 Tax=Bugula neritina TaxID=10212 RepID=A0A7J7K8B7_BUGNE|nr:hypothetical protein EB796_007247 [Bugula neritina]